MNNAFYEVRTVFTGVHFQKQEDIKFDVIWVKFTGIHEWVNISLFKDYYDKAKRKNVLEISSFDEITLVKDKDYNIGLNF